MTRRMNAEQPPTNPVPAPGPEPANAPAPERGAGGTTVAVRTAPTRPKVDQLPPFRVLLHNDDVNEVVFVVQTIMELTPLQKERAIQATLEAHTAGVALLLVTHKERAELYRDQFKSKNLEVSIEPA